MNLKTSSFSVRWGFKLSGPLLSILLNATGCWCTSSRSYSQAPHIDSFAPSSGPVGAAVSIVGTHFGATTTGNIVYFGGAKAPVTAAEATSLTVTVPSGASFRSISVTVNGLTAFSKTPYLVTFPATPTIDASAMAGAVRLAPHNKPTDVEIGDLNGDGKMDLVVVNSGNGTGNTLSVYRNTSSAGTISTASFAQPITLNANNWPFKVAIGDLDGDGKLDLAVVHFNSQANSIVSIYRNTTLDSANAVLSFAGRLNLAIKRGGTSIHLADLDGDGRLDLAGNSLDNKLWIFRNIGAPGNLTDRSFAGRVDLDIDSSQRISAGDLDGDSKPDLVVAGFAQLAILRNISSQGIISAASFSRPVILASGNQLYGIGIGDLDGDAKPDLAVVNNIHDAVSLYRNIGSPGSLTSLAFAPPIEIATGGYTSGIALGDLNGDGKLELAVGVSDDIAIFQNHSSFGSLGAGSFGPAVRHAVGNDPIALSIGDLDGDGKPEIAVASVTDGSISLLRNAIMPPGPPSATETATLRGYSLSIPLGVGTATLPGKSLKSYFTSYDGSAGVPLYDVINGNAVFSSELSPIAGQSGGYHTDYALFVNGVPDSSGTVSVNYPTTDSDSNGVPDFLQAGSDGSISFTGSVLRQLPSPSPAWPMSGQITRLPGSTIGSYVAAIQDPAVGIVTYRGTSYLLNANGALSYSRSASTASITAVVANEDGTTTSYSGGTGFTVADFDHVNFPAATLNGPNGRTLRTLAYTLTRSGRRYLGTVQFQDGGLTTSWPDYLLWRIEVTDHNDTDGDGVPDLSDALPGAATGLPFEDGQIVNGYQDDFTTQTRNPTWIAFGPGGDLYHQFDGVLHVSSHTGDPNHLLYTAPGYRNDVQEVLARIRVTAFGPDPIIGGDSPRGGISVGVQTDSANLSRGLNLHFRDFTQDGIPGRQVKFLDDLRSWGPPGFRSDLPGQLTPGWLNNVWYWTRMRLDPNADGFNDLFGKIWVADGITPEPSDWQLKWRHEGVPNSIPKPLRKGFAGIAASSNDGLAHLEVDYVLIKADGLPQIKVSINPKPPEQTQLRFTEPKRLPGGRLEIVWVGEGVLEEADALTGPWATTTGLARIGTIEVNALSKFYRLRK